MFRLTFQAEHVSIQNAASCGVNLEGGFPTLDFLLESRHKNTKEPKLLNFKIQLAGLGSEDWEVGLRFEVLGFWGEERGVRGEG